MIERYQLNRYSGARGVQLMAVLCLLLHVAACSTPEGPYDAHNPHPDRRRTADGSWHLHDRTRPHPPRAEPNSQQDLAIRGRPPPEAVVLFDGRSLDRWKSSKWKVAEGFLEIVPGTGDLETRETFGSCHLHLEWWTPPEANQDGQNRGNSGVFLMSRYEIQILDTFDAGTYADGVAGALYGVRPPDFNALRPAGEWQSYDIEFRRPVFTPEGRLIEPARVTVRVNGVLVHENAAFDGSTSHSRRAGYRAHPDRLPLVLQDHNEVVRFRNIWLLPLPDATPAKSTSPAQQR